jgi:hypothetical protein
MVECNPLEQPFQPVSQETLAEMVGVREAKEAPLSCLLPWLSKIQPCELAFLPSFFDHLERYQERAPSVPLLGKQLQFLNCADICRGRGSVPV